MTNKMLSRPADLDPKGVVMRKSRDRDDLSSLAVAVVLDAGMAEVAASLAVLPDLLGGVVPDPQVLLAVGEGRALQIGTFDRHLDVDRFVFAGTGAAHELAAYYLARHTSIDCYERHGVRGHAVFVTGCKPGRRVIPDEARDVIGDHLRESIPAKVIMQELQERYELHVLVPAWVQGAAEIADAWVRLLGRGLVVRPEALDVVVSTIVSLVAGQT